MDASCKFLFAGAVVKQLEMSPSQRSASNKWHPSHDRNIALCNVLQHLEVNASGGWYQNKESSEIIWHL
eukprot:567227-Amphidinium_carterae.2